MLRCARVDKISLYNDISAATLQVHMAIAPINTHGAISHILESANFHFNSQRCDQTAAQLGYNANPPPKTPTDETSSKITNM